LAVFENDVFAPTEVGDLFALNQVEEFARGDMDMSGGLLQSEHVVGHFWPPTIVCADEQ
jgi:hypothetical protein